MKYNKLDLMIKDSPPSSNRFFHKSIKVYRFGYGHKGNF